MHFHKQYALPRNNEWIFNPGSLEVNDAKEVWREYTRGFYLIEVKDIENPNIRHMPCVKGKSESSDEIPNRFFLNRVIEIGTSNLISFEDAISHILKELNPYLEEKMISNIKKDDLELPIVLLTLKGTISYSKLEVNLNELKERIMEKFDILYVRIFSGMVNSKIDGIVVDSNSEKSIEEIEHEVFSLLIEQNPDYQPHKNEIIQLMLDLKSSLLGLKPNFDQLKDQIKFWWKGQMLDEKLQEMSIENNLEPVQIIDEEKPDEFELLNDGIED